MDAYLVPVLAAFAGAFVTAAVLGAVRLGRWWRALRGRAALRRSAAPAACDAPAAAAGPEPGPGEAAIPSDPHLSRLAHHSLGAALVIALTAFFCFVPAGAPGAGGIGLPATVALLAAWAVGRTPR
jgi:hypothetical protein